MRDHPASAVRGHHDRCTHRYVHHASGHPARMLGNHSPHQLEETDWTSRNFDN